MTVAKFEQRPTPKKQQAKENARSVRANAPVLREGRINGREHCILLRSGRMPAERCMHMGARFARDVYARRASAANAQRKVEKCSTWNTSICAIVENAGVRR